MYVFLLELVACRLRIRSDLNILINETDRLTNILLFGFVLRHLISEGKLRAFHCAGSLDRTGSLDRSGSWIADRGSQ